MVNKNLGIWINKNPKHFTGKVGSIAVAEIFYYYLSGRTHKHNRSSPLPMAGDEAFVKVSPLELAEWT